MFEELEEYTLPLSNDQESYMTIFWGGEHHKLAMATYLCNHNPTINRQTDIHINIGKNILSCRREYDSHNGLVSF